MHDKERRALFIHLAITGLGVLAIGFLFLGLAWAFHLRLTSPGALDRGQLLVVLPLGLWWIWLLRRSPVQFFQMLSDLKMNAASSATGLCNVETRKGIGVIAPQKRYAIIEGRRFHAIETIDLDPLIGRAVEARYGSASGVLLSLRPMARERTDPGESRDSEQTFKLTAAEKRRLEMIAQGLSDKLIARKFDLSPSTVRTYNSSLFRKLGAANRNEAASIAREKGLIDVDIHRMDTERAV